MLSAEAPSGGCITLLTYSEDARAVSWYQGLLTAAEDAQFWKSKNLAQRGGAENWASARALLEAAGWDVRDGLEASESDKPDNEVY
jgi:hypothetical protein